ncbi:MAG: trypsin-like peptidase domain-containing protein [Lachnospiraceae bacterium]|nr:trypsin-like peptidase domain-containing protein [Lachnospiraceae bacterium]MBQ5851335.1 trypsin-like peptidase domain-containing protein [Lachnospiraceae bacterium]
MYDNENTNNQNEEAYTGNNGINLNTNIQNSTNPTEANPYNNVNNGSANNSNSNNRYQEYFYSAGNASTPNGYNNPNMNYYNQHSNQGRAKKPKKPKNPNGLGKKMVSVACLGLVFGLTAGAAFCAPAYISNLELKQTKLELEQLKKDLAAEQNTQLSFGTTKDSISNSSNTNTTISTDNITAIANSCLPSVVSITNKGITEVRTMFGTYQQDSESSGSGIIIGENESELLIVTNYHVISGSNELSVVFSYDEDSDNPSLVSAKVKGYAADKDLAVIAVSLNDITDDMRTKIKVATIGNSANLELGQQVVAIGNALGYGQSVTTGIISALNREVSVSDEKGGSITNKLIQTDAAINPGNSGGALINMNGELIGINSVKVASSSVEGMGYAIPISDVESIIKELMLKETRDVVDEDKQGYLGIAGTDVTSDIASTYDMPVGVYVSNIYENSPAAKAGIIKGNIITKFDDQTVSTMSELKSLLTYYEAGETVNVVIMVQKETGYSEKTVSITLGTKDIFGDDAKENETNQNNSEQKRMPDNNSEYYYDPFSWWP